MDFVFFFEFSQDRFKQATRADSTSIHNLTNSNKTSYGNRWTVVGKWM